VTTSVLRPDGTINAGGATFVVGANWQACTNDDSDTSWAVLAAGAQALLTLGTVSLPAGAVTKQARVRMRARSDSASSMATASLFVDGFKTAMVQAGTTTAITSYTGAYVPAVWTQAQVDGLTLQEDVTHASIATRYVELYVDLVYATVPTVVILSPTGTTALSSPTVQWTYTQGSDGGPQSRYRAKVFTAAVIAGGGFDPETSTAVYDSGEVASSATSHVVGPFNDMVNCGAYVKVAQTVNGAAQWSAWDPQTFTVDITAPEVLSVVPTAGTGNISVVVNRNTGTAAWTMVTVERSTDSGTTWTFVRGATRAAASGNTFTVVDYEAPYSTNVLYRAQAADATTSSVPVNAASQVQWTSTSAWLKNLDNPTLNLPVRFRQTPELSTSDTSTVSLVLKTDTVAESDALEALLGPPRRTGVFHVLGADMPVVVADSGSPLLVQFPPAWGIGEMWLAVLRYSKQHLDTRLVANLRRVFNVELVEIERPPDTGV